MRNICKVTRKIGFKSRVLDLVQPGFIKTLWTKKNLFKDFSQKGKDLGEIMLSRDFANRKLYFKNS